MPDHSEPCALKIASLGEATLDKIGACFGITRERVRQIEEKAMRKLGRNAELLVGYCPNRAPHTASPSPSAASSGSSSR